MLTVEGFTCSAILRSVSPFCIGPYVSDPAVVPASDAAPAGISALAEGVPEPAVGDVAEVEGAAAGAAAGGVSAGRGAGAAVTVGSATRPWAYPGGSRRIGYSRWTRPAGQVTSIRTSMNGSFTGAALVTLR